MLPAASAGRELPDGHHHRVVPRRHLADDADRLAPDVGREAGSCTRRRCGPRAAGRRRRRSGSGRRPAGSPRPGSAGRACRCSAHSAATISSARLSIASANFSSACCRSLGVVSRQVSKAVGRGGVRAGRRPRRRSCGEVPNTSPVLGSTRSSVRPSAASLHSPLTKLRTVFLSLTRFTLPVGNIAHNNRIRRRNGVWLRIQPSSHVRATMCRSRPSPRPRPVRYCRHIMTLALLLPAAARPGNSPVGPSSRAANAPTAPPRQPRSHSS